MTVTNKVYHDLSWQRFVSERFHLGPDWAALHYSWQPKARGDGTENRNVLHLTGGVCSRHQSGPDVGLPNPHTKREESTIVVDVDDYGAWARETAFNEGVIANRNDNVPGQFLHFLQGNSARRFDAFSVIRLRDLMVSGGDVKLELADALTPQYGLPVVNKAIDRLAAKGMTFNNGSGYLSWRGRAPWPIPARERSDLSHRAWAPLPDAFRVLNFAFGHPLQKACEEIKLGIFREAQRPTKSPCLAAPHVGSQSTY